MPAIESVISDDSTKSVSSGECLRKEIEVGQHLSDGTGDTLRGAFIKVNENFEELYGQRFPEVKVRVVSIDAIDKFIWFMIGVGATATLALLGAQ